jgi:hypothetical protein
MKGIVRQIHIKKLDNKDSLSDHMYILLTFKGFWIKGTLYFAHRACFSDPYNSKNKQKTFILLQY